MSLSVDFVNLVLYFAQQLGVVLGVGAQTILLMAFLNATRDGKVDQKEEQFGRTIVSVLKFGLVLLFVSGVFITAIHISFAEAVTVETPAFIFKWILIIIIGVLTFLIARRPFAHFFWEGMLGAHWYALFVIHILAPLVAWLDVLVLYSLWTIGFILAWSALVYKMRAKKERFVLVQQVASARVVQQPKTPVAETQHPVSPVVKTPPPVTPKPISPIVHEVVTPPPPQPKPIVHTIAPAPVPPPAPKVQTQPVVPHKPEALPPMPPLPVVQRTPVVAPVPVAPAIPQKPAKDPDDHVGLPAIRVMPRNVQDVDRQMRASIVQFE